MKTLRHDDLQDDLVQRLRQNMLHSIALDTPTTAIGVRLCARLNELAMEEEHGYFRPQSGCAETVRLEG